MSARLFDELRIKRGLAYSLGAENEINKDFGYFAMHAGADKKNILLIKKIFLEQIKLPNLTDKEIEDAKNYTDGHILRELQENAANAAWIAFSSLIDHQKLKTYIKNIKKVTKKDIQKVIQKYFKNPTIIILEQK